jgi:pre-mRNA-splicing helicase BRR2
MLAMIKPAYLSITEVADGKPTIVFVPSRKQCKLTANDLLAYCLADSEPKRFLNIDDAELQPHLEHVQDQDLVECLKYGIGYYHEALGRQDKRIVASLMNAGAIRVLVASKVNTMSLICLRHLIC